MVEQSYLPYSQTDFKKKRFQTSMWEHSHASAAIVLSVIGIEAYSNRICFIKKVKKNTKKRITAQEHICKILQEEKCGFPYSRLLNLLDEVFVVRDVIAHNHIYKVEVFSDQQGEIIGHKQKLLKGYGFDSKYKASVNSRTKKTNLLKLNVQPAKIGFEDIFKVLVVIDLLIEVINTVLGIGYAGLNLDKKIGDHYAKNISDILTHYYGKMNRKSFIKLIEGMATQLRIDFSSFLLPYPHSNCFIQNICPKCSKLGFDKIGHNSSCKKCGLHMGIDINGVFKIEFDK